MQSFSVPWIVKSLIYKQGSDQVMPWSALEESNESGWFWQWPWTNIIWIQHWKTIQPIKVSNKTSSYDVFSDPAIKKSSECTWARLFHHEFPGKLIFNKCVRNTLSSRALCYFAYFSFSSSAISRISINSVMNLDQFSLNSIQSCFPFIKPMKLAFSSRTETSVPLKSTSNFNKRFILTDTTTRAPLSLSKPLHPNNDETEHYSPNHKNGCEGD